VTPTVVGISPTPTHAEAEAIAVAVARLWPAAGAVGRVSDDARRWRFSGRWWIDQVAARRRPR